MKKYQIIYADPPWNFNFQKRNGLSEEAKSNLYPTMKGQDIIDLPIKDLADDDCVLFLWVMNSEIPLALKCIENWGFTYKTVGFVWVKTNKDRIKNYYFKGPGYWTRANPEICILATKGKPKRVSTNVDRLVVSERREHSRKPDEIRNMIVELCGDIPRIELFARHKFDGWDSWGNQV